MAWEIGFVVVVVGIAFFLGNLVGKTGFSKKLEEKRRKKMSEKLNGRE